MADGSRESFGGRWIWSNVRRVCILVVIVSGESLGLRLLRLLNPRLRLVQTLFVMYPANEHYAKKIVFPFWLKRYRRRLAPCMVFRQNGVNGIVLGTTLCERELRRSPELLERLKGLADEASRSLGIEKVTYSGVLPTLLLRAGLLESHSEARSTAKVVAEGIEQVRATHGLAATVPIAVLGGAGQIGRRVVEQLELAGRDVHVIDPAIGTTTLQEAWRGRPLLLANVAHRAALRSHIADLWSEVVYINEAYPEPRPQEIRQLRALSIPVWHVAGVKARSLPPFPGAYGGGIPCCAAVEDRRAIPVLRKLI